MMTGHVVHATGTEDLEDCPVDGTEVAEEWQQRDEGDEDEIVEVSSHLATDVGEADGP